MRQVTVQAHELQDGDIITTAHGRSIVTRTRTVQMLFPESDASIVAKGVRHVVVVDFVDASGDREFTYVYDRFAAIKMEMG